MLLIGLTGGIASGKSTVSRMLQDQGAIVIDADVLAREAVEPGTSAWQALYDTFGAAFFRADRTLDRSRLGELIFHDPAARQTLNQIVHPAVRQRMQERLARLAEDEARTGRHLLVVLDIPLLYEGGLEGIVQEVWVATCPEEAQITRIMARDGLTRPQAVARIRSQMPLEEKVKRGHRVIDTHVPLPQLQAAIQALLAHYRWDPVETQ